MEDVSTSEPRSSAADDALRVVFGERRDEVAALCVASPASRAACAGLAGSGDRGAAVEAALARSGRRRGEGASRQSSEDAVERARAALGVAADLCAACGGGAAAAAAAAPARAGSGRCVAMALDIAAEKAEHRLEKAGAAAAAAAAACALPPADAQTAAWWRARPPGVERRITKRRRRRRAGTSPRPWPAARATRRSRSTFAGRRGARGALRGEKRWPRA